MKDILCTSCNWWCDCGKKDGKPWGFCFYEPLFTYTARTKCADYSKGNPMAEEEYENYNSNNSKKEK